MQKASLATHVKVQYLPVNGPPTTANALPYLASLIQRRCDLILAAGTAPVNAVAADAARFTKQHFAVIGAYRARQNITVINTRASDLPAAVAKTIIRAVTETPPA
jgi:basic membrane lipoprotein Med (substrate-binding protein (PBP1-ABC) superfamily)